MDDNSDMAPNPIPWNKSSEFYCSHDKVRDFHLTVGKTRLKKEILAEMKRAHQLTGRCIFIDLDMGFPEQVA
jgi:hypothetical protein